MQSLTTEQARKVEAYTNTVGALSDIAFSNLERLPLGQNGCRLDKI